MIDKIRIGTRSSPLSLQQTYIVRDLLAQEHGLKPAQFEIIPYQTTGDQIQNQKLIEIGGKGLFTKEIERALYDGEVDLAVHSMKDVTTTLPPGLVIDCILKRGDPRDAWISDIAPTLAELPAGCTVGTSSLRRGSQVLHLRPDLKVVTFRGKVETRLAKIKDKQADATLLAFVGLQRLNKEDVARSVFEPEEMLPAVGQGALGVQCREDDTAMQELVRPLNDEISNLCVSTERAFLRALDGSCRTPIAAFAELKSDKIKLTGLLASPDGTFMHRKTVVESRDKAPNLGTELAMDFCQELGESFVKSMRL